MQSNTTDKKTLVIIIKHDKNNSGTIQTTKLINSIYYNCKMYSNN